MTAQHGDEAFYDRHWEHTDTAADPHVVAKGDLVLRMIPDGVRTIADVGCGDGYLTGRLAERWEVIAIDRSAVALERARARAARTIQASADALPLPDRAVDLLFSSQVLEHLPDGVLQRAAAEMARVAGRYLFVSVPYRETLRRRFARCPRCRHEFNTDGHLQSFHATALDDLFPQFERIVTELAGPAEDPTYAPLEWLRQHLGGQWNVWDGLQLSCPQCGGTAFRKQRIGLVRRLTRRALDAATAAWRRFAGRTSEPYWILSLYRRREAGDGLSA